MKSGIGARDRRLDRPKIIKKYQSQFRLQAGFCGTCVFLVDKAGLCEVPKDFFLFKSCPLLLSVSVVPINYLIPRPRDEYV